MPRRIQLRPTVAQLARPPVARPRRRPPRDATPDFAWTFGITGCALFMFALDRLIVASALPVLQRDLGASVTALEWTVNAFTLAFAALLLTCSALGDRFGRRRLFTIGVGLFAAGSAAAALAPSAGALIAARAVQGAGGAVITPLGLTLLLAATPPQRRGAVLGAWGATAGIAAASGPVLGGVLADALSWHWIFWLNVPIGFALVPLARAKLTESHGPRARLDLPGLALSSAGLLGVVGGLVEGGATGWGRMPVLAALTAGTAALVAFIAWERRAPEPMLPPALFGARAFTAASVTSVVAYAGIFGALFVLGQVLQTGLGASPLHAGLGLLPMTAAMVLTAPAAGALSDRIGTRPVIAGALVLEALALTWLAVQAQPGVDFAVLAPGLAAAGIGSASLFAPLQATQVGAVAAADHGKAAGAAVTIREVGGVLGVAVIVAVFSAHGDTASAASFLAGARPALLVAALAVAAAACLHLLLAVRRDRPRRRPASPRLLRAAADT